MAVPLQRVFPGRLEAAYRDQMRRLVGVRAIEKIWANQPALWKPDADHAQIIADRLGWIGVLDPMRQQAEALHAFAGEIRAAGLRDFVLLGMGGSSLAPEVFSLVFPPADRVARFFVLDSTDPASVLSVERALDFRKSLFIVASKSGKTIETLSQFRYFFNRVQRAGLSSPGQHFIAITDAGSDLDPLAAEHGFRRVFRNPADVGGRYSALSYFGLVPAALWGVDLIAVLDSAIEMREACGPQTPSEANPALALGALMATGAEHGADKLALVADPPLAYVENWIEQLVAESTGKEGKGIVPIAGATPERPELFAEDCVVVVLARESEQRSPLSAFVEQLQQRGVPVAEIRLGRREQFGGEFFKWEVATAVAGAVLGIDPFDEPNVQESKDNTARLLAEFERTGVILAGKPLLTETGIELHATRSFSESGLGAALRAFFSEVRKGDYLALLAFVDRNDRNERRLNAIRLLLRDALRAPVLPGYGPRYLHSIGQLYKGGPPKGCFLEITAADEEDVPIPGASYTFGQLKMAQALGDLEALQRRGRPALRLHLLEGAQAGLVQLHRVLEEALGAPATGKT